MRELHGWEKDPEAKNQLEILINTLITDHIPGMENLAEVEIPAEKEELIAKDLEEDRSIVRKTILEDTEKQQQEQEQQ